MNIKELREMIADFPDDAPVRFELEPTGTQHVIEMRPSYSVPSGAKPNPENANMGLVSCVR